MPESKLKIRLLGVPDVSFEGAEVRIPRHQIRSLLFYLAANQSMVGRSDLILKFIKEDEMIEESAARQRIRKIISLLGSALPDKKMLVTQNDQVGLNLDYVEVDAIEFRALYQKVENSLKYHHAGQALPPETAHLLNQAIRLWPDGNAFLQGWNLTGSSDLETWQTYNSTNFENMRESIINHLAMDALAIGDLETGARWLHQALEINQFTNEETATLYLSTLKQLGRINEALNIASLIQKRYEEYDDEIPAELKKICDDILSQFSVPSGEEAEAWGKSLSIQSPFIGRQKEMDVLKRAYQKKGGVVIWGEVGQGKSRLVYEFYQSIIPPPRLMVATCHQMEVDLPFQPLIDMQKQFINLEEWQNVDPISLARLRQFIPDILMNIKQQVPSDDLAGSAPVLIYEALYQVLLQVSGTNKLLIFIDNAQWCDESSLHVLEYLFRKKFFAHHGFLILTVVPGEKNPALDNFIKSISPLQSERRLPDNLPLPGNTCEFILLGPLSEKEVGLLVNYSMGEFLPPDACHRLARESSGNPFILIESLRWFIERYPGTNLSNFTNEITLPPSITQLLRSRLTGLDYQLREVLNSAAVIGSQFTLDSVAEIAGFKKEETASALDQLNRLHLVKPVSKYDPIGGFTFTYPRLRSILLMEMSEARKQLKNQRVAHYLETFSGKRIAQPAVLAQHFEAGGDFQNAFTYWLKAADYALHVSSMGEAQAACKAASNLVMRQPELFTDNQIIQVYTLYADVSIVQQDLKTFTKIGQLLLLFGRKRMSHLMLGVALILCANVERRRGKLQKALEMAEDAVQHLKNGTGVRSLSRAYYSLGTIHKQLNHFKKSQSVFETAQQMMVKALQTDHNLTGIGRGLGYIENELALLAIMNGSPLKAQMLVEQAIERLEANFDFRGISIFKLTLLEAHYHTGIMMDPLEFDQKYERDRDVLFQDNDLNVVFLIDSARTCFLYGYLDESWQTLEKATQLCQGGQFTNELLKIQHWRSSIFQMLDCYPHALEEDKRALALPYSPYYSLEAMLDYGINLTLAGDTNEAERYLERVLQGTDVYEFAGLHLTAEAYQANLFSIRGEHKKACEMLMSVSEKASRRSLKMVLLISYFLYGVVQYRQKNFTLAQRLFLVVVEQGRSIHLPWIELECLTFLHQINCKLEIVDETIQSRAMQILAEIHQHATIEPIKTDFENYFQKLCRIFTWQS
jgi:tetratricopeptide (TPR) repeat protein